MTGTREACAQIKKYKKCSGTYIYALHDLSEKLLIFETSCEVGKMPLGVLGIFEI